MSHCQKHKGVPDTGSGGCPECRSVINDWLFMVIGGVVASLILCLIGSDVPAWYLQHMNALATGLTVVLIVAFGWRIIKLLSEI